MIPLFELNTNLDITTIIIDGSPAYIIDNFYKEPEKSNLFQILKKMDERILNSRYFKFLAWSVLIKAKKS